MKCPYCGCNAECDEVDIGVGMMRSGPYGCGACLSFEMTQDDADASEEERRLGWYRGKGVEAHPMKKENTNG